MNSQQVSAETFCQQSHRVSLRGACRRRKDAQWSKKGAHLQVSDREALTYGYNGTSALVQQAQAMVTQGHGEDILTRRWDAGGSTPITARRYLSFTAPGGAGDDDMFSSDLTDSQLKVSSSPASPCHQLKHMLSYSWLQCAEQCQQRRIVSKPAFELSLQVAGWGQDTQYPTMLFLVSIAVPHRVVVPL